MDLTSDFQVVSGRAELVQALWRRWTTDRGGLLDDPNYGTNLTDALNDDMTAADVRQLLSQAEAEARKDERVISITSSGSLDVRTGILTMQFEIVDGDGPFSLTLSVNDLTVELLQVGQ